MKREKITVIPMGNIYKASYSLDVNDVVDAKVYDMSRSGMFPHMIPCDMQENGGARTFEYTIEGMRPLPEIIRTDMGKRVMLTVIYNVLEGLEAFGKGMVSLSYVAKEIQHIFVSPETYDVKFIVAPVDKEFTDMNEVRSLIKTIIVDARYSEADADNYVARLINYVNMPGTFSSSDMKNRVKDLLMEMGADVPEPGKNISLNDMPRGNSHILRSDAPSPKVSRLGVMRNNARMNGAVPPMGANGMPMNGQMPPMGPNGMPMNGQMPPMGPNGMPMNGQMLPMGPNGMPSMAAPKADAEVEEIAEKEEIVEKEAGQPDNKEAAENVTEQPKHENSFNEAPIPPMPQMPPMGNPFGGAPVPPMNAEKSDNREIADGVAEKSDNEEAAENVTEQPDNIETAEHMAEQLDNKEIVDPMVKQPKNENPFNGAPIPPMPQMPPMGNPFGEMPVPPTAPVGIPSSEGPAPYFVRTRTGERINLDKAEFKIGHKVSDVDYVVSDNSAISRVHCVITKRNGVCFIRDNHSTNGTYINGDRLNDGEERFLTNNAFVILGNEEFVYHIR